MHGTAVDVELRIALAAERKYRGKVKIGIHNFHVKFML